MATVIGIDTPNFATKQYFGSGRKTAMEVAQSVVDKARGAAMQFPDGVVYLAFDCEGDTFRHEIFPEYKAGRKSIDHHDRKTLDEAFHLIRQFAHNAGIHVLQQARYEADDLLASLARACRKQDEPVHIISEDKDFFCLVNYDGVRLWSFISAVRRTTYGLEVEFTGEVSEAEIWKRYGIESWQWTDFRSMTGDPSDNIKGLEGYGEKLARLILLAHPSLDNMYADWETHREGFTEKQAAKFEAFREELPRLRHLFRMVDSLDVVRHQH